MAVYRRGKRWVAQRWDPELGRPRQVGTFATKREAEEAIARETVNQQTSRITVAEWYAHWIASPGWRHSTRHRHRERTKLFVEEYGPRRLTSIDRKTARAWIVTRKSDIASLSAMFGAAMFEDNEKGERLLADNPFSKLVRRRVAKRDIRADWLPNDEVVRLEGVARQTHGELAGVTLACMIRFAAETGVRPGELFVLEEDDLDLEASILRVRRSWDSKTKTLGPPKNGEQREVYLSAAAAAAAGGVARRIRVTPMPLRDPYDQPVRGDEFWLPRATPRLFSTRTGRQWTQSHLANHWGPVRNAAGRPGMEFYELRHFCATRLLELGLRDDEVAVQLGHTDGGKLVRETYGHPNNRRALERVREALDGAEEAA